ncbi:MAG: iron-sulfur cluster carrier protein ApbC [Candidatus Hydrogenedentota bacterium]|nr:MAG: iron-sulfur cluster carrier protein ApbC [Candidatus Hydrogenedentota bacterium]
MVDVKKEEIFEALKAVIDPELKRDIVSLGMVKEVDVSGADVSVQIELTTPACPLKEQIASDVRRVLKGLPGMGQIQIRFTGRVAATEEKNSLPGVGHVVAVGSGKGGVGKSTVAVNTALALSRDGARVGLLDADVYGPNVPTMLGVHEPERVTESKIVPARKHGIRVLSMGFFLNPDQPVIWRGPMLHSAVKQFLYDVEWGELDYLIVDLPPGTGDVQLSLSQMIPVSGAVIVATPQNVALEDAAKAVTMLRKVNIEILGVVENMSYFICPHCSERVEPFGHGGAEAAAKEWCVRFLGRLPMDPAVRTGGDAGEPPALRDDELADAFRTIARNIAGEISTRQHGVPRSIALGKTSP